MTAAEGFGPDHLPYGVVVADGRPRVGVRLHDTVLDLHAATGRPELDAATLNPLMGAGPAAWAEVRDAALDLAATGTGAAYALDDVEVLMPFEVGDYVDFYASPHHAANVGRILRPDSEPLLPNWRHLPVGYHGRAGTVVPSGTPVVRPCGQRLPAGSSAAATPAPEHGPTRRLDIEAELGFVVGTPSRLGEPVPHDSFADHVFGVVGLNDWSARDIQAWEYVPLGPFLGKSFATSVSRWVTPLAALSAAWVDVPPQDPRPLPHLLPADGGSPRGLDLEVEVELDGEVVARPPYRTTYWSPAQMLAHLTSNGASVRTGDLYASGTISGPEREQRGSLLELSWGGREPFVAGGRERTFLEDGDTVVLRYSAPAPGGGRLTLGEVAGTVLPARGIV